MPLVESSLDPARAVRSEVVLAGEAWLGRIERGQTFRIVDLEGNQAVDTLFFNAADPARPLQRGRHDPRAGQPLSVDGHAPALDATAPRSSPSSRTPAAGTTRSAAPAPRRATRSATAPHEVDAQLPRQLPPGRWRAPASRTSKRDLAAEHQLLHERARSRPKGGSPSPTASPAGGKYVEMRAEADVLCLISNCPQLNNPCNAYNPTPIRVLVWAARLTAPPRTETRCSAKSCRQPRRDRVPHPAHAAEDGRRERRRPLRRRRRPRATCARPTRPCASAGRVPRRATCAPIAILEAARADAAPRPFIRGTAS